METVGRRVRVVAPDGEEIICRLKGMRAVVGDEVTWEAIRGSGGRLVDVLPRRTALARMDFQGREQVVAANLAGLLVVQSAQHPGFRPALLDRYRVVASHAGIGAVAVINKMDLGFPDEDAAALHLRVGTGLDVIQVSAHEGSGLDGLRAFVAENADAGPWALVGGSGVGKTSIIAALLPDQDVGAVAEVSEYWDTGRHTTTTSRIFALPDGGEIVDSPGIRNFTPGGLEPETLRGHFPGMRALGCRYRDCLHREGEDGCVAEEAVAEAILDSYRTLLNEVVEIDERSRPG